MPGRREKYSNLSFEEIRNYYSMDTPYQRHERGEIGASEYFAHLRQVLELDASDEEMAVGWNAIFAGEISPTVDYVLAAGDKLPTFAFTNSNPTHQVRWTTKYPRVVSAFERVFVSSELGLRKPERAAFNTIAEATGIRAANTLFFDDLLENVQGALSAGLQTVHVQSPSDVERALSNIGVL